MKKLVLVLIAFSSLAFGQISVPVPMPHVQFLDVNGHPLSGGFVFTYAAGTTTPLTSYQDSIGTANTNPIVLDAGGFANIWIGNSAYKFEVQDLNSVPQWTVDNVTGYFGLLNTANVWTSGQTFNLAITDLLTDNQFVVGAFGNQTTLDFPPPSGNIALHFPNTADTLVGRATTDTLTNKTLTLPTFNATACPIYNGPATYVCIANQNPTGTTPGQLVKLVNAPSQVQNLATSDTSAIGLCNTACGNTGTAVVQESGTAVCTFDGTIVADHWVIPSITSGGQCHDSGIASTSTAPTGSVGITLCTSGGCGNPNILLLLGAGSGGTVRAADVTGTSINGNTSAAQVIKSGSFPAGALNAVGKAFRLTIEANMNPAGAGPPTSTFQWGFGTSASLTGGTVSVAQESASATAWYGVARIDCIVGGPGATASIWCTQQPTTFSGTQTLSAPFNVIVADLTAPFYVGSMCTFSAASTSNVCLSNFLLLEQLN